MKDGKVPRFFNVCNGKNCEEGGSDSSTYIERVQEKGTRKREPGKGKREKGKRRLVDKSE